MKKLTLNKLNKIRAVIETEFSRFGYVRPQQTSVAIPVLRDKTQAVNIHSDARGEVLSAIEGLQAKLVALYELREIIHLASDAAGVTSIIHKIALKNDQIKFFVPLSPGTGTDIMDFELLATAELKKENAQAKINVNLFSKDEVKASQDGLAALKKELTDLQDERNAVNHATLVDVPDQLINYLVDNSYI